MPKPSVDLAVIAFSSPILIGIYQEGRLVRQLSSDEKTSDCLPGLFQELMENYTIEHIVYARGPGSYLSLKLLYVFLKTLEIAQGVKLLATDGFTFTNGRPIKAVGNRYFVKREGEIVLERCEGEVELSFSLPEFLPLNQYTDPLEPLYILPAV